MNTPTATFYAVRQIGKNQPLDASTWTFFSDVNEKAAQDLGLDKYEAVRITVEPITHHLQKNSVEQERNYWRRVAAYLASCHAATAYEVLDKKSSPKGEKRRQLSIMAICVSMLKGIWPSNKRQTDDLEAETKRCQECFDRFKETV